MAITDIQKKIIVADIVATLKSSSKLTKTTLRRSLSYKDHDFDDAFEFAIAGGIIIAEKGNWLNINDDTFSIKEDDYYDCVQSMLERYFTDKVGKAGTFIVKKTARKESKIVGRWTRPDFTVVTRRSFPYIKEVEFDIFTFEVKRPNDCDTLAVFEALAHNTVATRSFVFFPITAVQLNNTSQAERVKEECGRHGVGLVLVNNDFKLEECNILIDAQRRNLNPEKCSNFLQSVLEADALAELSRW